MDFLLLGLGLLILLYVRHVHASLRAQITDLQRRTMSRQGAMRKRSRGSQATPMIDARVVTTRRDTDDIPTTGRMGKLQPRRGGDDVASTDHDGGLQEHP